MQTTGQPLTASALLPAALHCRKGQRIIGINGTNVTALDNSSAAGIARQTPPFTNLELTILESQDSVAQQAALTVIVHADLTPRGSVRVCVRVGERERDREIERERERDGTRTLDRRVADS